MKASDLFAAGTRIIGILAIIKAIGVLIMTVPSLFGHNYPGWAMHMQIMTLVYPLALLLIGIYLFTHLKIFSPIEKYCIYTRKHFVILTKIA